MSDRAFALGFIALVLMALGAVAAVAVAGHRAEFAPAPGPAASGPPASCTEWTDGCVVCRRGAQGPICSTPGIACTRGAQVCLAP